MGREKVTRRSMSLSVVASSRTVDPKTLMEATWYFLQIPATSSLWSLSEIIICYAKIRHF